MVVYENLGCWAVVWAAFRVLMVFAVWGGAGFLILYKRDSVKLIVLKNKGKG